MGATAAAWVMAAASGASAYKSKRAGDVQEAQAKDYRESQEREAANLKAGEERRTMQTMFRAMKGKRRSKAGRPDVLTGGAKDASTQTDGKTLLGI